MRKHYFTLTNADVRPRGNKEMTDSVLIPTGTQMKSYAPMRSLNRRGIHTIVASERDRLPHFSSRYCSERVELPAPPENVIAYKDALLELARRSDVETIIPVRETDTFVFAKWGEEFSEHVSLVTPDLETLEKGHDRYRLAKEAETAGVPVAETRLLSEVDSWDGDVVVKSRYNLLTSAYVDSYPHDVAEELKHVKFLPAGAEPDTQALRSTMKHEPIVQEFVPQTDKILYTALWDHGEPLAQYQHRQIRQNSWVGGGGVYRKSVYSEAVEQRAEALLGHLDWHGFACIEYLEDEATGEWKFLEINPRVWQSMPEAVRANADFPYYYWLQSKGEGDQIDPDYELGKACHLLYGEASHLLSVLRDDSPFVERPSFLGTAWDIGTSILRHPRFDYIRADDPQFFLASLRRLAKTGVTASRQYTSGDTDIETPMHTDGGTRK